MNKELSKEEIFELILLRAKREKIFELLDRYADQQAKKATEALKNIQSLLSGEPSEENAKDAYLIASDTLKLFNQQK